MSTWSAADTTDVLNSNSGVDAVSLPYGGFLLVNNPLRPGENWWNGRNVLDLEYSSDGTDWYTLIDLERHEVGEYSYPAIIQTADGRVHITYTYNRRKIQACLIGGGVIAPASPPMNPFSRQSS